MKPIVRSLALCIALAVPVASQAGDSSANPLARGKLDFEPCKNHFILSAPDPCASAPHASWVATSDMHEARTRHTATLLKDGTVLVAGGGVASAELYDPRDGSWTMTGPLSRVWGGQTAILLPSGKVLVLGNMMPSMVPGPIDNSAEIYDPATRQWTSAEGMQIPRVLFTATLLDTGKVLVVGGDGNDDQTVAAAELYDPETNTWAFTGKSTGLFWHTATKLRDGRVLIAGGTRDDFISDTVTRSELYDPATGVFVFAGDMQIARGMHVATLLDDGSVLVTGGFLRDCPPTGGCRFVTLSAAERYDPLVGRWLPAGSQNVARMSHTATLLSDRTVLLTGGDLSAGGPPEVTYSTLQSSERFDASASSWGGEASMKSPRADHTATLLPDGSVLVAGGRQSPNYGSAQPLKSAELYGPIPAR